MKLTSEPPSRLPSHDWLNSGAFPLGDKLVFLVLQLFPKVWAVFAEASLSLLPPTPALVSPSWQRDLYITRCRGRRGLPPPATSLGGGGCIHTLILLLHFPTPYPRPPSCCSSVHLSVLETWSLPFLAWPRPACPVCRTPGLGCFPLWVLFSCFWPLYWDHRKMPGDSSPSLFSPPDPTWTLPTTAGSVHSKFKAHAYPQSSSSRPSHMAGASVRCLRKPFKNNSD